MLKFKQLKPDEIIQKGDYWGDLVGKYKIRCPSSITGEKVSSFTFSTIWRSVPTITPKGNRL